MSYALEIAPKVHTYDMSCKGFKAALMRAPRLKDTGKPQGLPPGERVPVYPVACLPGCPEDWVRSEGSYVCPVDPEWGLWFDWRGNDELNTAVLTSVKGLNPITGQKIDKLRLEKFTKCPIHDEDFCENRLCKKCGYKWPAQSYVAAPNTLWWDGFRQADGTVRQFFFSADEERDIASHIIGKKNTVPAFGFAFFKTKVHRTPPKISFDYDPNVWADLLKKHEYTYTKPMMPSWPDKHYGIDIQYGIPPYSEPYITCDATTKSGDSAFCCNSIVRGASMQPQFSAEPVRQPPAHVNVSIGAGAQIDQDLQADSLGTSDWVEKPAGLIRLYFVFRKRFEQIVEKGIEPLDGDPKGFLKGLPVG